MTRDSSRGGWWIKGPQMHRTPFRFLELRNSHFLHKNSCINCVLLINWIMKKQTRAEDQKLKINLEWPYRETQLLKWPLSRNFYRSRSNNGTASALSLASFFIVQFSLCRNGIQNLLRDTFGGTVYEFLSDAPFSNLVSERCALPTNCACASGWSCTMNLQLGSSKMRLSYSIRQGE